MKKYTSNPHSLLSALFLTISALSAGAQGIMQFDQQSSDQNNIGEFLADISSNQPIGQSFTPSLSAVRFVQLYLSDNILGGVGGILSVSLLSDSVTGAVLSVAAPVSLPQNFKGIVNFFFPTDISVSPGTTYYFRPAVQSGDGFAVYTDNHFQYSGGTAIYHGTASTFEDLWFREGIIVPEPSAIALVLFGGGVFAYARRKTSSASDA
jgi:PEP-CTERM motif